MSSDQIREKGNAKINFNERSASADILKSIAIFAVVFIHGAHLIPFKQTEFDLANADLSLISNVFRICVPVFIFLWAYFQEKSIQRGVTAALFPRLKKLLIPFLFWSSVYFLLLADLPKLTLSSVITKHWSGYGWSGQYYFIIIFQLVILFPIIRKMSLILTNSISSVFLLSVTFFTLIAYSGWFSIAIIEKLGYRIFIYWLPYVTLGIIYANRNKVKPRLKFLFAILLTLLVPLEVHFLSPITGGGYLLPSIFISSIILCIELLNKDIKYVDLKPFQRKIVLILASNTLGIFCLNPLIINVIALSFKACPLYLSFPGCSIIIPLCSTILVISVCLLLITILKRLKLHKIIAN